MTTDRHIGARCALTLVSVLVLALFPSLAAGQGVSGMGPVVQLQENGSDGDLRGAVSLAIRHGVDPALLNGLTDRGSRLGIEESVLLSWVRRLDDLARRDLPVAPVVSRYLEGLAKSIPPSRIDIAVDHLEARLVTAARRIDAKYSAPGDVAEDQARLIAIDHGAYVLGLGISEAHIDQSLALVHEDAQSIRDTHAPMLTLGILVASGITPDKSLEVINAAWNHGYRGPSLERLGKALGRLGQDGKAPPVEMVDQVLRMIDNDATQEKVFEQMDDLNGRDDYQLPGMGPADDPTIRRGDTNRDDRDSPSGPTFKDDTLSPIDRGAD